LDLRGNEWYLARQESRTAKKKPAALRNAQKPHAARAAFAQALYSKPGISEQNSAHPAPKLFPRF
jgi:hypothetical protein